MGGFKLRRSGFPQIFSPLAAKLCVRHPKVLEAQERARGRSSITMPGLVGLGFHPSPGWSKTLSFLSVCLFVCLFVCPSEFVRPISP